MTTDYRYVRISDRVRRERVVFDFKPPETMQLSRDARRRPVVRLQVSADQLQRRRRLRLGPDVLFVCVPSSVPNVSTSGFLSNRLRTGYDRIRGISRRDAECLSDERCHGGVCKAVCNSDSKCGPNQICENRLCVGGCRSDTSCPDNEACIDKQCRGEFTRTRFRLCT